MTFEQFTHQFLENEYHLSRYKNAAFSAITVAICIAISFSCHMGMLAGAFIIGAQSVTGINRQGAYRIRLSIAAKTAIILSLSALLGSIAGKQVFGLQIIAGVILAFSFGWWRQLFPLNWPDIIIPASVLFFMNYVDPGVELTAMGAMFGLILELLLGGFIYLKRYYYNTLKVPTEKEIIPNESHEAERTIFGLKSYLFLYSIELSLLLAIGFVFVHYSSYQHAYWLPLTTIIVLKVGRHGTYRRVIERTLGTLAGCILASILLYFHVNEWVDSALMVACIFIWLCFLRYQYAVGTVFITTFVLLLLSDNNGFSFELAAERIIFTITAGVLVLLSSRIFLTKERRQ
jgi:hypothetical protein